MLQAARHFQKSADPANLLQEAREYTHDVQGVLSAARNLISLLEAQTPVCAFEVTRLLDRAEELRLVNRAGMKQSGLYFVVHEPEMQAKAMGIKADDAMTAVYHIASKARRANNILNRKEGAYTPVTGANLYGAHAGSWTPILP